MISVEEARKLIMQNVHQLPVKEIPLHEAGAHFAATEIISPHDHPLFDNSAVDGYAFKFDESVREWKVVESIPAGMRSARELQPGECVRIFTGAMMPHGADTVVMQEFVDRRGDHIVHSDQRLKRDSNVRLKGEQIRTGRSILEKGAEITAAASGLLASVGVRKLKVHEWPYVSIVITGDEFIDEEPAGKIFSSNDVMLAAALRRQGTAPKIFHSKDDPQELLQTLRHAMSVSDLVITTGGVSVGEHDLVHAALQHIGATVIFHIVAQKPGKPMLFGTLENKPIFALPGNPRAVMILFWEFVLPVIRTMMGAREPGPMRKKLKITHAVELKGERSEFRAARTFDGTVELLQDQGSHMLSGLIQADSLVYFPRGSTSIQAGDEVEVHPIPER